MTFVPQMVELLVDFLAPLDFRVPEQVIEVPKIVCPRRAARTILDVPQTAEQLVEVPTILSFISLQQQTVEQIVDIPVPGRERRSSGLLGFLPGQGSTALRSSQKGISKQIVEQIVDFSGGGLQDFRPEQCSSSSSHSYSRSELPPHSSPWTPAAYDASLALEEEEEEEYEEEPAIQYVECDGCWWGCEWVPARQRYCWWLAAADGSQAGHITWRPPWLIGTR